MSKDIDIHDQMALFASNAEDLLGFVTYEGTISQHEPQEIHIDTENKTMSVVFENHQEEKICDLSPENVATINKIYAEMKAAKKEILMGFYQVDGNHKLTKSCYNVDVLVM